MPGLTHDADAELARAFGQWEARGRGWTLSPDAVELEPLLTPFRPVAVAPLCDDGRREWRLSWRALRRVLIPAPAPHAAERPEILVEPAMPDAHPVAHLHLNVGRDFKLDRDDAVRALVAIGHVARPVSFEFIAADSKIQPCVVSASCDADHIERTLRLVSSDLSVSLESDLLSRVCERAPDAELIVELGLNRAFLIPLEVPKSFSRTPSGRC